MREGAPLGRMTARYHTAADVVVEKNKPQISRRNYKKFLYDRNQQRPRKGTPSRPHRSRRRLAERRRKPAGPPRRQLSNIIWPERSDLMSPTRSSAGKKIILPDLAASSDSWGGGATRRGGPRRRSRRSQEDYNALLDSAKIKLENIIESFSEKLSKMTLES